MITMISYILLGGTLILLVCILIGAYTRGDKMRKPIFAENDIVRHKPSSLFMRVITVKTDTEGGGTRLTCELLGSYGPVKATVFPNTVEEVSQEELKKIIQERLLTSSTYSIRREPYEQSTSNMDDQWVFSATFCGPKALEWARKVAEFIDQCRSEEIEELNRRIKP